MKTLHYIFVSALFLQLFIIVSFAQSAERSISVVVSGIAANERFVFVDHNSREVAFESNKTIVWGRFPVGSSYRITQMEGSRQCRLDGNQGTIPNSDVTIRIDCTLRVWVKFQVSGIQSGERFSFGQTGNAATPSGDGTYNWKNLPAGTPLNFSQISGPRQCTLSNNPMSVPNTDLIINIDCAAPFSFIKLNIFGIETGERFEFKDHDSNYRTYSKNETLNWQTLPQGSSYKLEQTRGPRDCRMTNNIGTVPATATFTITADCARQTPTPTPTPSQTQAQLRISVSGIKSGETFEFVSGSNRFTFTTDGTTTWGDFPVSSSYNLTQSSGPRQCRSNNNQGTFSSSGATINFDCMTRYSTGDIRVFGIEPGESFTFRKSNFGVSYQNGTHPLGNYLVGERYSFSQGSGPRQCVITNNPGIAPETDWTIVVDCSKPSSTPTPTPTTTQPPITLAKIDLKIQINGIEAGETFNFKTHQITNGIEFNQSGTVKLGSYIPGSNYSVLQNGGPRQCRMSNNQGTMQIPEILVVADCTKPPSKTLIKITVSGIESGEHFRFNAFNGSWTEGFYNSQTTNIGSYAVGLNYSVQQIGGPRQCTLTNNSGVVPTSEVTVIADCRKSPTNIPVPTENPPTTGTFGDFDLISRSLDQKTFSTFFKSYPAVLGGVNETGVAEGQFAAYVTSTAVDPNHDGKKRQIIWFNRGNGKTALVSQALDGKPGDNDSFEPAISANGYQVVFESTATNLAAGDANKVSDVFVWNLMNSSVSCISCSGNGASSAPSISGDGNTVAFVSNASNLTAGVDGNTVANVYVKDMRSGQITLISKDPKTGKGIGGRHPSVSEDGSRIAFYSFADKLVDNDRNNLWDIFVWERGNPKLKRISMTGERMERDQGNESASRIVKPTISGNGKYVAFSTTATNMGGGANGKTQQVYVVEIDTGRVVRASETADGTTGNGDSPIEQGERISLSYDGKWVAFTTKAANLGGKIIVKNVETGEVISFKIEGYGGVATPALSRNGKCVAFPASENLDKRFDSSGVFAACR